MACGRLWGVYEGKPPEARAARSVSAPLLAGITAYGPQDVGLKKLYDMARIADALDDDAVAAGAVALAATADVPAVAAEAAAAAAAAL
jgi:hypothetical protein